MFFQLDDDGCMAIGVCQGNCRCAKKVEQLEAVTPCCISDEGRPLGVVN